MAPLPESNTVRIWVDYSDGVNEHSLMARVISPANQAAARLRVHNFLFALSPSLYLLTITGARVAALGSNVTNPMVWDHNATYGTGVMPVNNAPRELRFIGRSADGRRNSVSVYGFDGTTPDDYRISATENVDVDAAIDQLTDAAAAGVFVTISGGLTIWKPYASFNFNSYWERQARS